MRLVLWFPLLTLLLGCGSPGRHSLPALTPGTATALAQSLANEKAQLLYQCQPFRKRPDARLENGPRNALRWVWSAREAYGNVDLEATVSFSIEGTDRVVEVLLLDNRRLLLPMRGR